MNAKQLDNETAWHLERYLAMSSLYYFATSVLNYEDVSSDSHKAVCELVEDSNSAVKRVAKHRWALNQYDEVFG